MIKKVFLYSVAFIVLLAVLLFGYRSTLSAPINTPQLDYYFRTLEENNKAMGSVAVFKQGEQIYARAFGYADVDNAIKANLDTSYRIGSTSKTYTAVLILKAVEEGRLELNQPLADFFPNIVNAKRITVEQMLNHRSGIYSVTSEPDFMSWRTEEKTRDEIVSIIKRGGSLFEPNTKVNYSNSNYILLSYILENIYRKPFAAILNEKITIPYNLKRTGFVGQIDTVSNQSHSYKKVADWQQEPETHISIPMGAGGMVASAVDIASFIQMLFDGEILKAATLEKMKSTTDAVGLGLFEAEYNNQITYEHPGVIDGFKASYIHFPEDIITITYALNGLDYSDRSIKDTLIKAVFKRPFEVPEFAPPYEVTSEDLDKYLGVYSSPDVPEWLKITIGKNGNILTAEGTMQDLFPASAVDKNKFSIGAIGAKFEFKPEANKIIWTQNGKTSIWTKE